MNAIFTGRRRSGKTTLAFYIAIESGGGTVIFDPKREFRGWPHTVSSIAALDEAARKKAIVIVYHPDGDTDEEFTHVAEWINLQHDMAMQAGWDKRGLSFTFLIDEAHNVQGPNWANPQLLRILSQNRPEILNVFQTFQSPKDAFNRIKSRVSDWYIFSTNLPSDIDYLEKEIGVSNEDVRRIQTMGDYEYAHFHFDGGKPVAEFAHIPEDFYALEFTEENKEMAEERNKEDKQDRKPQYPIQLDSDSDVYAAYNTINRRKKDDPKTKYHGRSTDRASSGGGERGGERGEKKVFKIGDWAKDKTA